MKILILLSLAGICLAKRQSGRSFSFPSQPNGQNRSHTFIWHEFGAIGPLNPEKHSHVESSEEPKIELRNPNRRDVKIGNFPARGFHPASGRANPDNDVKEVPEISLSVKSKSPLIKQEEPSFTENRNPVLENEKSSSSESSSNEQSSESASANNQGESSSSEENPTAAAKQEESSSSEENSPPAVNQEEPLVNEESSAPSNDVTETPVNESNTTENPTSEVNDSAQVTSENEEDAPAEVHDKNQGLAAKLGLQPFVPGSSPKFSQNALRKLVFSLRDVDGVRPEPLPRKTRVRGSRLIRGIDTNFSEFKLGGSRKNIQEPQGQIKGANAQRRWRKPVKK